MMKRNVSTGLTLSNEKQITHDTFYLLVDLAAYINIELAQKLFVVTVFLLGFFVGVFAMVLVVVVEGLLVLVVLMLIMVSVSVSDHLFIGH